MEKKILAAALTMKVMVGTFPVKPPSTTTLSGLFLVIADVGLSHVVADGVWQDDHAALALLQLLGDVHRRCHGRSRAASCQRKERRRERDSNSRSEGFGLCNFTQALARTRALTAQQTLISDQHTGHVEGLLVIGLVPGINHLGNKTSKRLK